MANSSGNFHLAVEHNAITVNHVPTHGKAYYPQNLRIWFHRTIRVPDNLGASQLPPGLGDFPLFQVKNYASKLPADMVARGGVFFPMHQKEALWIRMSATAPFMVKIYAGGVNVVSGEHKAESAETRQRRADRHARGENIQDYVVPPLQYWVDGFAVAPGVVRQFVAMPVGSGYNLEAQLAAEETIGGLQLEITPARPELVPWDAARSSGQAAPMGIAPGGRIKQCIVPDPYDSAIWSRDTTLAVAVQILNSAGFRAVTGLNPPPSPVGAQAYADAGLPFFQLDESAWAGSAIAGFYQSFKSVNEKEQAFGIAEDYEGDVAPRLVQLVRHARRVHVDLARIRDPQGLVSPAGPHREFRAVDDLRKEAEEDRKSAGPTPGVRT
ncbi:hypothetical protein F4809DRAFT_637240 [Biscogniauxia mediterranea]|nr:hypothetical protein F4809DRAFT_637240 [Biscogniauxia mediterranea]